VAKKVGDSIPHFRGLPLKKAVPMIHHVVPGGRYGRNGTGGYCRHVYVGYVERCTITVFLNCDEEAFRFLCGTFVEALYDNMASKIATTIVRRGGQEKGLPREKRSRGTGESRL
jgi:hypothetical protein